MAIHFTPPATGQQFSGTITRGSTVREFDIPKAGIRPYWEFSGCPGRSNVWRGLGQPRTLRNQFKTTQAGTDRAYIPGLNDFLTIADGFWNGGTAHVYAVTNGVPSRIATGAITATKPDLSADAIPVTNWLAILFDGGATAFAPGETLTGATTGATATIDYVFLTENSWGSNGTGSLILSNINGTFANNEVITSASGSAVAASTNNNPTGSNRYIRFDAGTAEFTAGETITGAGGATATIDTVYVTSGSWAGNNAAGSMILSGISGSFVDNEAITSAGGSATANGNVQSLTTISRFEQGLAGTTYEGPIASGYKTSAGVWYRVAAVDQRGQRGTWSSWVQYTTPSSIGTTTAANSGFIPTARAVAASGGFAAPANVAVAAKSGDTATAEVTWDAVSGAAGYVVDVSFQDPTLNPAVEYIDLDTTDVEIPAGCIVFLEQLPLVQTDKWSSLVWNTSNTDLSNLGGPEDTGRAWVAYTGGDPAPTGVDGEYFFRRTMTGSGNLDVTNGGASAVLHSGRRGDFYKVLEPGKTYRARFRLRANASITATLALSAVTTGSSADFNLTTEWQTFETTFTKDAIEDNNTFRSWSLTVPSACVVDFAEYYFWEDGFALEDFDVDARATVSPGMILRDISIIGTNGEPTMRGLLSRTAMNSKGRSIRDQFFVCRLYGCRPWIQPEFYFADEDWLALVANIAGPSTGDHWAIALRVAQGQTAPWIDEFPEIIIEFGNEAWNSNAAFWSTVRGEVFTDQTTSQVLSPGATYAMHVQRIINVMKTSPYWRKFRSKVKFFGGTQDANTTFENAFAGTNVEVDIMGGAGYLGGWETTSAVPEETGASFIGWMRDDLKVTPRADRVAAIEATGRTGGFYESGPGFALSGLNNAVVTQARAVVQTLCGRSRGMGTANLGAFCVRAAGGYRIDSYFTLGPGSYWNAAAFHYQGGGTYMSFELVRMIHDRVGRSEVRKITLTTPPTDGEGNELLQAYEFKSAADPSNRVIVGMNFDIDVSQLETDDPLYNATPSGTYALTIPTGIASCTGLSYYANVGPFRQHNRYPAGFRMLPDNPSSTSSSLVGNPVGTADSLCVAFAYDWTTGSVPGSPGSLVIDDTYGAAAGGLPAGNCVLLHLQGCVDA